MVVFVICLTFLSISSKVIANEVPVAGENLRAVVQIIRDCHRSPLMYYENDPYKDHALWPYAPGFITELGYEQCKELGVFTKKRYVDFLPEEYSSWTCKSRAINLHRCEFSVQSLLQGIFAEEKSIESIWYNEYPVEVSDERIFGASPDCKIYSTELSNVLIHGEHYSNLDEDYLKIIDYIEEESGSKVKSLMGVYSIFDTLMCEDAYGFELPEWTQSVYPQPMDFLAANALKSLGFTDVMKKLTIGAWFTTIIEYFEAVLAGTTTIKYQIFSGEVTNLAVILNTFTVFNLTVPPFGSSLYIELREVNGVGVINLYYKHDDQLDPLRIGCCDFDCPLEDLKDMLGPFLLDPVDYEESCAAESTKYTNVSDPVQGDELDEVHQECVEVINSQRKDPLSCTSEVLKR